MIYHNPTASLVIQSSAHRPLIYTPIADLDEPSAELRPQHQACQWQDGRRRNGANNKEEKASDDQMCRRWLPELEIVAGLEDKKEVGGLRREIV
ncbi:hypothetical protein F2Q69_00054358 [Brassica cretica]|uniref:Uncharacterized protein n=1 Tax=Brassica cretica TaxID=69181 RepID=A0A8S9MT31_BRACR|nr:hypothetical protein F2Q69_00054358 [Brassica cretica]